ncbi:methyltransferase domain-containing protein [Streptomyces sp. NPDC093223]|uniref:methyltransferase domain-containing protein n=1 Tax=Streptomyces sp. NPDC093223 TaxID=3366033 RepID=UPI00380158C6
MTTAGSPEADFPDPWAGPAYGEAVSAGAGDLSLRDREGWSLPLDVGRWTGRADAGDRSVVERCVGRVLDIGCGGGRLVEALASCGREVLGIDVSPSAVASTLLRGGAARSGSVFGPLPKEGSWDTALLIDGNIGIGGAPHVLLRRIRVLVHGRGLLIVECVGSDVDECRRVRMHAGQRPVGASFSWATVGSPALVRYALTSGWSVAEQWTVPSTERHFVALRVRA